MIRVDHIAEGRVEGKVEPKKKKKKLMKKKKKGIFYSLI